jgi:hypothetical protein
MEELISKASDTSQNIDNIPSNLRLLLFHLDQRIEVLEKNSMKHTLPQEAEEKKEGEGNEKESKDMVQQAQVIELNGIRNVISRQEIRINDVNIRLTELEYMVNKLEPNNIRALIKDIAELIMHEETREVTATVDSLKGTEKRNEHLMNMLKEELKIMDERFKQDIEKKIERDDLFLTKAQLQKKVINSNKSSCIYLNRG